jgi:hypothetical protein
MRCSYILQLVAALLAVASEPLGSGYYFNNQENVAVYTIECDHHMDSKCSSPSLEQIARNIAYLEDSSDHVNIMIKTDWLLLGTNITFSRFESLTISGDADLNATISCQGDDLAGLVFSDLAKLTITELTVVDCGAAAPNTYISAIAIFRGRDVSIEGLVIEKSKGIGLMIADHQGGTVTIDSSNFIENKLPIDNPTYREVGGGGGVYVGGFEQDPPDSISMIFTNCTFSENIAHTEYFDFLYTDDLGEPVTGYGLGGGVAILFNLRGLTNIDVLFSNCTFTKNEAFKGGGLIIDIGGGDSETRNITVRVEASVFEENGCGHSNTTISGGGMHVSFATQRSANIVLNEVHIRDVDYIQNCAHFGGGLYFYSDVEKSIDLSNSIIVEECTFEGNRAHTGSAVDITPNVFQRFSNGIRITPIFRDCRFMYNTIRANFQNQAGRIQTTYGIGTLYVSLYSIILEGYNTFENNLGTAIHVVNGKVNMSQSSVRFFQNHGRQGGAMALIGEAFVIFGPNKSYSFVNNTALGKGGGLYVQVVDNHDVTASKTCFIQYSLGSAHIIPAREWMAEVVFAGNIARGGTGHAIFATSLYPCQTINVGTREELKLKTIDTSMVFSERGIDIEENADVEGHQIATEGARFILTRGYLLKAIPGERFTHGVIILDDLNQTTTVVLTANVIMPNIFPSNIQLDTAFSSCVGEHIILKGMPGEAAALYLQTITPRLSYTRLMIEIVQCPPGFKHDSALQECVCNTDEYTGLVKCNTIEFHSRIARGFWTGLVKDAKNDSRIELATSFCPLKFCNYNGTDTSGPAIQLPQTYEELDEALCGKSRTGIACGNCKPGFTTYFHSPNFLCKPVDPTLCKVGWLFYILSELVPVTVIFVTVMVLNISFTSGAVNGFIFFCQVLTSLHIEGNGFITFSPSLALLTRGYQLIYGIFNFDMFQSDYLSFCLWPNASALDMLAFKYITIVYALLLVFLVIWFMRKFHRFTKYFGTCCRITTVKTSVIHGVSAFLILCYSQCLKISLNLLNGYYVGTGYSSDMVVSNRVTLSGNIVHFSGEHLPYALPALFCLLTMGIFPPLLLLSYPLSNKVLAFFHLDESRTVNFILQKIPINRLKPLLDSFQGCFKDNLRFFAGLYFLYRSVPLLLDTLIQNYSGFYTAVEVFIIIILALHAFFQPYTHRRHNRIDTLLFADLAVINAITFIHYFFFANMTVGRQTLTEYVTPTAAIQLVFIYLPLLVAVVCVLVQIWRRCCRKQGESQSRSKTKYAPLSKLKYLLGYTKKEDKFESDTLPHRLLADVNYECLEDTNDIDYVVHETYSETDIDSTY